MRLQYRACIFVGLLQLGLTVSLELATIHRNLDQLLTQLQESSDIQDNAKQITVEGKTCVTLYQSMMKYEGSVILALKEQLEKANSPNDVIVTQMSNALGEITKKLETIRLEIIAIQSDAHLDIEACKSRRMWYISDVTIKRNNFDVLESRIANAESEITQCDEDAKKFERDASGSYEWSWELEREAKEKYTYGAWGFVGALAGIALAPLTGWTTLSWTAAAISGTVGVVHVSDAGECRRRASELRDRAYNRRIDAENLKSEKKNLNNQKEMREAEIAELELRIDVSVIDSHREEALNLEKITDALRDFLDAADNTLETFQDMDKAFKDTKHQTESFKIIKNAFSRDPERLEAKGQEYLDRLKEKWRRMKWILVHAGAQPSIAYTQAKDPQDTHEPGL